MMTASIRLGIPAHCRASVGNGFVLLAMTVVTLAFGLGLHLQLGLAAWVAVVVALSLLMALVSGHLSIRRSETEAKLQHEIARLEGELAVLKHVSAGAAPDDPRLPAYQSYGTSPDAFRKRQPVAQGAVSTGLGVSAPTAPSEPSHAAQPGLAAPAAAQRMGGPPPLRRLQFASGVLAADSESPRPGPTREIDACAAPNVGLSPANGSVCPDGISWSATAGGVLPGPAAGYWPFRRAKTAGAGECATSPAAPVDAGATEELSNQSMPALANVSAGGQTLAMPPAPKVGAVSDADVAEIHGVIKKLAEELRAAKSASAAKLQVAAPASPMTSEAAVAAAAQTIAADSVRDGGGASAVSADHAEIGRDISAGMADVHTGPAPLSAAPANARLAEVASAVAAARLDVYLEPILGLTDLRARHYEVSVRLRSETGASIAPEEFGPVARGTGLLPLIDAMSVSRSVKVAGHLSDRGAAGSLFSQISGESLASHHFLREFTDSDQQSEAIAERLVLSFAQSDVRGFAAPEWATLRELVDLGFRFALEDVSDLDMDFEALTAAGFAFAKFDARVFLEGLPAQGGLIPAADLCRYLAHLGLTLIVGRIDDEAQLAKVLGFGVLFGQGTLFGAPRPVKAEVLGYAQGVAA
jgi:cyclic-di-GMP phosphodiesterase TipF (flagellum assembly factor)